MALDRFFFLQKQSFQDKSKMQSHVQDVAKNLYRMYHEHKLVNGFSPLSV